MKALIADAQWLSRAGLAHLLSLLEGKWTVVEAASFDYALERIAKGGFDLCLVDPALHDGKPVEGLRRLRAAAPKVPIAVVTDRASRRFALQAIEAGAQGFILKSAPVEEIRRAVERVRMGEISLPSNLDELGDDTGRLGGLAEAAAAYDARGESPLDTLTSRQRDVLALIATGKRNAEIAKSLHISPRTVQIHVSTILKLLGIGNRTEAALLARKYGVGG